MISIEFPLPCKPLTMNQRLHWATKAKITRAWRAWGGWAGRKVFVGYPPRHLPRSVVRLTIPVRSIKVRRDPHNWFPTVKAVVDGLVDAGLWPDDTSEYVITVEPKFRQGGPVTIDITPATAMGVTA